MTGVEGWSIHGRDRRIPGDQLFSQSQAVVDVAPTAAQWIRDVAAAHATDPTTLTRIADYLRRDDT